MLEKLSAVKVASLRRPGRYYDGGNLALIVDRSGRKSWAFFYMLNGRSREMSMGNLERLSLAEARAEAHDWRKLLRLKIDPINHRRAQRKLANGTTFEEAAKAYIAEHEASWKNAKHAAQWPSTLKLYAYPIIGSLSVASIESSDVLSVLKPLWQRTPETASRLRSRIERILDFAKVNGWRSGENAAAWRGNLALALPSPRKLNPVEHHPALPYRDVPAFMVELRKRTEITARALELLILTASRTNEIVGARWSEVDWREKVWHLPAIRMKGATEHVVPLSDRALAILESLRPEDESDGFIFLSRGQPLSNMALLALLRRMKVGVTAHGFRSSFRDWAAEQTNHQHEVAEAALAHKIKSKTEAAYRRGTMLAKRRTLMGDWATFCETGTVTELRVA